MQGNTTQNNRKSTELDNLLTRQELCDQYGFNYRTVEMWAHKGKGPKVTRLGRRAYYHVADIAAWIEDQRKKSDARFAKAEA